jgi:hypothetical protein
MTLIEARAQHVRQESFRQAMQKESLVDILPGSVLAALGEAFFCGLL